MRRGRLSIRIAGSNQGGDFSLPCDLSGPPREVAATTRETMQQFVETGVCRPQGRSSLYRRRLRAVPASYGAAGILHSTQPVSAASGAVLALVGQDAKLARKRTRERVGVGITHPQGDLGNLASAVLQNLACRRRWQAHRHQCDSSET